MYSTNSEYRAALRGYFQMDTRALEEEYADLKECNPESYDEFLYDEAAMKRGMNNILKRTEDDPRFTDLYIKAAGQFLSEEVETGLCVLLTFDYFADFIRLYENPTEEGFKILMDKL
jgi:hypothetical protein